MYDDTARHGGTIDHRLVSIADLLREHVLMSDAPFSDKTWRVAGYRFAKAVAQNRRMGFDMTSAFQDGMRIFAEQHATIRPIVPFNEARANTLEERAAKFVALASHKNTGAPEQAAAINGLVKLYTAHDLAIIANDRHEWQLSDHNRLRDAINFVKTHHPEVFPWKPDEQSPVDY